MPHEGGSNPRAPTLGVLPNLCCKKHVLCILFLRGWWWGLRAADPSNVQGPVNLKQNASPGEQSEAPETQGGSRGSSRTPGPENQDSQHMLGAAHSGHRYGRLIFIHHQCWEVLLFCRFLRQRCIKTLCPKDPDFYTPLALKKAKRAAPPSTGGV